MTSKGKQEMGKTVITRQLQIGDKFKIPGNPSQTYEVVNIKGDYLIYRNVRSHEEFQMVRGFASKVDLVEESATYQKKRFKEPYYMYNESAKTIKESSETKKDYLKYIDQFEKDVKKYIDWMKRDVKENKEIVLPDVVVNLATAITNAMNRYNNAVKTKTLTEGFMVKQKLGNTYIGRFDSKDKAEKAVKDLAKRRGQSEADWLIEPDDKYMAAATEKGSSSWGPIPMNTLVEDYALITDVKVGDTIIYHGKELKVIQKTPDIVIANDDKGNATKFNIVNFNEPIMIKEANKIEEGFIISDTSTNNKPVYFHYGKYTGYDWGFDKNAATKFSTKEAAERMIEKMRQEGMLINSMKVVSEGRIAKGYENLDADEKARHLLSHPSSKYMNDLKSENITERAIRKAVKEMLGKPDKRDPQFIIDVNEEGEAPAIANTTAEVANPDLPLKLKESFLIVGMPSSKIPQYIIQDKFGFSWEEDKKLATRFSTKEDAEKTLKQMKSEGFDLSRFEIVKEDAEELENSIKYQTSVAGGMGTDAENASSAKEYEDEVSLIKEHRPLRKFIKESK